MGYEGALGGAWWDLRGLGGALGGAWWDLGVPRRGPTLGGALGWVQWVWRTLGVSGDTLGQLMGALG